MISLLIAMALTGAAAGDAWPAFRGVGDSVSQAQRLPLEWSKESGVAWTAPITGYGQSSPVVWGKHVFVTSADGANKEKAIVACYELASGERLWQKELASDVPAKASDYISRAAPTPACDSERVYAFFEMGNLVALTHAGEPVWQRSLTSDYGDFLGNHSLGSSLAITDKAVIVLVDHDGPSYLLAVDKATGKNLWKTDRPKNVSWTSPIVSGDQVIVSSAGTCQAFDAATGKQQWVVGGLKGNTVPSATATAKLVLVGSSDVGSNIAIRRGGEGEVTDSHVAWRTTEATATFSSPLVYQGHVYSVSRAGVAFCLSETTGKTQWTRRIGGSCWASPVGGCDRVYFFDRSGKTTVVAAGPELKVLAENSLPTDDKVYGVAAVEGRFVVRHGSQLVSLVAAKANTEANTNTPAKTEKPAGDVIEQQPKREAKPIQSAADEDKAAGAHGSAKSATETESKKPADANPTKADPASPEGAEASKAPKLAATALPDMPRSITSFGAAVLGDDVYVYGGHFGDAHHYSDEGQSGDLLKLNLTKPEKWEVLTTGPRLQGLALVAHGGKLYRMGGFEARNKKEDKQDLHSTASFARFDPKTKKWEDLRPMPSARSSFDAVVVGDILYVVGGWAMVGGRDSNWQETAVSIDLSDDKAEWKELTRPDFKRRAISLGAAGGKLYCIGGMEPSNSITSKTAVYDIKTAKWSDGPDLPAISPMEGFGSSAFAVNDRLYVSTISGMLLRLGEDGKSWDQTYRLPTARFFHRMVATPDDKLLFMAGASMVLGKFTTVETVKLP